MLIRESEGLQLIPYLCPTGHLTVGYGHRTDRRTAISIQDANGWLELDIEVARRGVGDEAASKCNTNQLAAVLSLVFNVGVSAFTTSTTYRMLRAGRMDEVATRFPKWNKGRVANQLQVIPGLVIRREAEQTLFLCDRDF